MYRILTILPALFLIIISGCGLSAGDTAVAVSVVGGAAAAGGGGGGGGGFIVPPGPPAKAANPSPANGGTGVDLDPTLTWGVVLNATDYRVHFGDTTSPPFHAQQQINSFDAPVLSPDTSYYWRIDTVNGEGTTTGDLWSFRTMSASPPPQATEPTPGDGKAHVSTTVTLTWLPVAEATGYSVYFGTGPVAFEGNRTGTTYSPESMVLCTTYYWRIDTYNTFGTTTGQTWSFVTEGATIYVNDLTGNDLTGDGSALSPYKSIQKGLGCASSLDTVVVADGLYSGPGNRDLTFAGKSIHLKSLTGSESCTINCNLLGRAFLFTSGETVDAVVDGFTIQNGLAEDDNGGAIACLAVSSPTIINCLIDNCAATQNLGFSYGGGIYCAGGSMPFIVGCTLTDNIAGAGGGICCISGSSAQIADCVIEYNESPNWGAGIFVDDSSPDIIGCRIRYNDASSGAGGGIQLQRGSKPTIQNCDIAWNVATWAGGVHVDVASDPDIYGCTIAYNTASTSGGGIQCLSLSAVFIRNSIIWGNISPNGNQLYSTSGCTVNIDFSCLAEGAGDVEGPGTLVKGSDTMDLNPAFANFVMCDLSLEWTSPCIDTGSNTFVSALGDINGDPRIVDGNSPPDGTDDVDMGAYEYQP